MISAILLAAGRSKRMLGENKLTKNFNGIPLIKYSIKNILASSIDKLIIVTGYQKEIVEKLIDKNKKVKIIYNPDFNSGMASSIKKGLGSLPIKTEAFFICLGDMPLVEQKIYNQIIEYKKKNEIIVPSYKKQQGNPILFSISIKKKIMTIKGDIGAKKILELNKNKIFNFETNDKAVIINFNTQDKFI